MIHFEKAKPQDAGKLTEISGRAFDDDIHYGAPGPGGPPGYKSSQWQSKMMRFGDYYKILADGQLIGGIIILRKKTREYEVGRIFIEPAFQNQGLGAQAFEFIWQTYPLARRWTLGTPAWNERTRHFYKKVGFVEIGQDEHQGILFEKKIGVAAKEDLTQWRQGKRPQREKLKKLSQEE
ncbi:MAG: GNAT family N-acetyltransferase [Anaerolineae bacterium]|nr:GNAT family N-acetyltransferase [Anaerolineae bacterium]